MAALHVNVRRHMPEMTAFRRQRAQLIGRSQSALRGGRHLHRVNIQVQQTRMWMGTLRHALFEHRHHLKRVCVVKRLSGFQIPQAPRGAVHHRFRKQGGDIEVAGELCVNVAHSAGVDVVPTHQFSEFLVLRRLVALQQGVKQGPLDGRAIGA